MLTEPTPEEAAAIARYTNAMHAVQTGVAYVMEREPAETTPKHLRVGVNSALIAAGALTKVLIDKGLITNLEYLTALAELAEAEAKSYEAKLAERYGAHITLR